ncbi:signal peptidase I [Deltaproteobacteria bacterium TL4]
MKISDMKTYKITKATLNKFKKTGFTEPVIASLSKLEEKWFDSIESFTTQLQALPESVEVMNHQAIILKYSGSYLRLDKWIPNKTIREWVEALIFALVVASFVRTFLFAPFKIPSGSMIPTIQIGDHIFATMYAYGIPVPFTDIKIAPQPIQRGDIVIFPYPRDESIDYIKRAIAFEGETIQLIEDQVYINNEPLKEDYAYFDPQQRMSMEQFRSVDPSILNMSPVSNFGPVTVPKGKLFALGDNRYNSADGRYWGFVEINKVKGKGQMIYWSHDPRESLVTGYKFERILSFLK